MLSQVSLVTPNAEKRYDFSGPGGRQKGCGGNVLRVHVLGESFGPKNVDKTIAAAGVTMSHFRGV